LPSPLENWLMSSSVCAHSPGRPDDIVGRGMRIPDEIRGRAECARRIRWVDISNPTPFMLAMLLCGIGGILRARRRSLKRAPLCIDEVKKGGA
jgi:hypothetical protein